MLHQSKIAAELKKKFMLPLFMLLVFNSSFLHFCFCSNNSQKADTGVSTVLNLIKTNIKNQN